MKTCQPHLSLLVVAVCLCGCATKRWQLDLPEQQPSAGTKQSNADVRQARALFEQADTEDRLRESILAYQTLVESDPGNCQALSLLGNQYILLGTAYTKGKRDKQQCFETALRYCEQAMCTNAGFREALLSGSKPWEAAGLLTTEEADAMLFWATAVQYQIKEVMSLPEKILNERWLVHSLTFLDRVEEVAPRHGGGACEVGKMICYTVLPEFRGGDPELAADYMQRSVDNYPEWILGRWARGKFYHEIHGNREEQIEDLRLVANASAATTRDSYPWLLYFQQDARNALAK